MPTFITITVVGDDNPFADVENQVKAYDHAAQHGAYMATGGGKPLMVDHTLQDPTPDQLAEMKAKMSAWLLEIAAAAKVAAAVKCPFNGRSSIPTKGRH
jgi:hypothetical protein